MEVMSRRIAFAEGVIQENQKIAREYNEKIDINRVRVQKIMNEIEVLKRKSKSALSMAEKSN